jgi:hypothetical protein
MKTTPRKVGGYVIRGPDDNGLYHVEVGMVGPEEDRFAVSLNFETLAKAEVWARTHIARPRHRSRATNGSAPTLTRNTADGIAPDALEQP